MDDGYGLEGTRTPGEKWLAIDQLARESIGQKLWDLLVGDKFQLVKREWPHPFQSIIEDFTTDRDRELALRNGTIAWYENIFWDNIVICGVADVVEVLHFAGFTRNVEAIFYDHPVQEGNNHDDGPGEGWYTRNQNTGGEHHPVQTLTTFRGPR